MDRDSSSNASSKEDSFSNDEAPQPRNLIYIIAFDAPGCGGNRLLAKMLVSSLLRTFFTGDIWVFRNSELPLFAVERKGLEEFYVDTPQLSGIVGAEDAWCWKYRVAPGMDVSEYDKVLYLDADFLALRNIDHLLAGDWDVRYLPERGHAGNESTYSAFYTEREYELAATRTGINSGAIAIKATRFHEVMAAWQKIDQGARIRDFGFWDQASWNTLLMRSIRPTALDLEVVEDFFTWGEPPLVLETEAFPTGEIQFPMYLDLDFRSYRTAALTHNCGMDTSGKIEFTFGLYMRTFFSDPSGILLSILEM